MEDEPPLRMFKNWLVATTSKKATSYFKRNGNNDNNDNNNNNNNFKYLAHLVKICGATHSKIVHKRVKMVISTDDAYKYKTQSIRKAIKYKIPIIHVNFLKECYENKKIVQLDKYILKDNDNEMSTYFDEIIVKQKAALEKQPKNSRTFEPKDSKDLTEKDRKKKKKKDKKEKKKKKKKKKKKDTAE